MFTNGVFDILHRGHATYLAQARALGASLVVAVNSDASVRQLGKGNDRPISSESDRAALVAALDSVSLVTIFSEQVPLIPLEIVRPDVRQGRRLRRRAAAGNRVGADLGRAGGGDSVCPPAFHHGPDRPRAITRRLTANVSARRLSARALWGLASWALPLAVIFLVTPSLLRLLGAERFGVLMICFVTPLLAVQLDCGITALAVRRFSSLLAGGTVDAARTLVTFVGALSVIGVALGALVWITADPIGESLGFAATLGETAAATLVRWSAVWIIVSLVTVIPGVLARSAQSFVLITAIQTIGSALLWGGALVLVRRPGRCMKWSRSALR